MKIENITEMTAGATGSGSVASVAQPVGKIQKRAGNLFKGKTTKKPFYEQEATSSIAQGVSEATLSEEDFILMPGQGRKLKPGLISKRPDHEVEMARGDLYQSAKNAKQICDMLSNVSEMQGLDGWVQAKITKASDYLNSVRQYLEGRQQAVAEGSDDICPQCGMKGCKCAPGKCKCKPKPGYPKSDTVSETEKPSAREKFSKGLKKAGYDPEKGADRLFSLLKKQAEEREKFEKAMPAVYGDKEGVAEATGNPGMPRPYDQGRADAKKGRPYDNPYDQPGEEQEHNEYKKGYEQGKQQGVAEGSLNEFAPDFNGGDAGDEFSPEIARMAQEDGFTKGVSLADGATLERAITINHWHSQHGGMYKQYFVKGFRAGRLEKIRHDNKQYNLNLKLMKDGSIRHGEQSVTEGSKETKPKKPMTWQQAYAHNDGESFDTRQKRITQYEKSKGNTKPKHVDWGTHNKVNEQGVAESALDEACWKGYHKEGNKKMFGKTYPNCVKNEGQELDEAREQCPECGGAMYSSELINEKKDACYYKVKSRYKVWPSAYASGALVKCRNKGASNWGNKSESGEEDASELSENLNQWFKEKWVRFGPDGKIRGDCARGDDSEGKPKCLPQKKAQALGKKGRASSAAKKRREDPNPERRGAAKNVATKVKEGTEQKKLVNDYDQWRDQVSALGGEIHPQQNKNHMVAQSWSGDTIGEFHMARQQGYIVQGQQDMTEGEDSTTVTNYIPKKK